MTFDDALQNFAHLALRTQKAAVRADAVRAGVLYVLTEAARARLIAVTPRELLDYAAGAL